MQDLKDIAPLLTATATCFTAIAALSAVFVAIWSSQQASRQFEEQRKLDIEVVNAQLKPILLVGQTRSNARQEIRITNHGLGPAKIIDFKFYENGKEKEIDKDMADLFEFPEEYNVKWNKCRILGGGSFYIRPGDEIILLQMTSEALKKNGLNDDQVETVFGLFRDGLDGVQIKAEYEDIFENQQVPMEKSLGG